VDATFFCAIIKNICFFVFCGLFFFIFFFPFIQLFGVKLFVNVRCPYLQSTGTDQRRTVGFVSCEALCPVFTERQPKFNRVAGGYNTGHSSVLLAVDFTNHFEPLISFSMYEPQSPAEREEAKGHSLDEAWM